jgi:lipopolysaccharide biosynthesis regulator YciM
MKTKLDTLKEAFLNKDYKKAISIASKFPRLGNEKEAIKLAQDCITNPSFYKQMGYDINKCVNNGIIALANKYEMAV